VKNNSKINKKAIPFNKVLMKSVVIDQKVKGFAEEFLGSDFGRIQIRKMIAIWVNLEII